MFYDAWEFQLLFVLFHRKYGVVAGCGVDVSENGIFMLCG
jgi:hypothetical protein